MPALEARATRLVDAHTQVVAISVDGRHSHAAWAAALGGISFPLLADFHPKGAVAEQFGAYLPDKGHTDRATILVDASGRVVFAESVTPSGERDIEALVARVEAFDASWDGPALQRPAVEARGLPDGAILYVRNNCMYSRWALYARANLHLGEALPVVNVSEDAAARAELERVGGKAQAPALRVGDQVMYESDDIARYLTDRCGRL